MKVLDLFSGLKGWSQPFEDRGHEIFTIDFEPKFKADLQKDIMLLTPQDLPWMPDVILASPPCEGFSVAGIQYHWTGGKRAYMPKSNTAILAQKIVIKTLDIIEQLEPDYWIMENPRGLLRKMPFMNGIERRTVTYCQYGEKRMKPTDLWGGFPPGLKLHPICKNGAPCHVRAPRGSTTGTQGMDRAESAKIPYQLSLDICLSLEPLLP